MKDTWMIIWGKSHSREANRIHTEMWISLPRHALLRASVGGRESGFHTISITSAVLHNIKNLEGWELRFLTGSFGGGSWTAYNSGRKSWTFADEPWSRCPGRTAPTSPARGGEDGGWACGRQPCVDTSGTKRNNPLFLIEWKGPEGRHDAPSPQSSARRSWTRSFGSKRAARPEGARLSRSSAEPGAPHPSHVWGETQVRTVFFYHDLFLDLSLSSNQESSPKRRGKEGRDLVRLCWNAHGFNSIVSAGRAKTKKTIHVTFSMRSVRFFSESSLKAVGKVRVRSIICSGSASSGEQRKRVASHVTANTFVWHQKIGAQIQMIQLHSY